jgi:signal transduction histidine kinase
MTGGANQPTRPRFTLLSPSVIRHRADRVGEQVSRKGRPRQRYLHEHCVRLSQRLQPVLATLAAASGAFALLDFLARTPPVARAVTLVETAVTILLGACALSVPIMPRNLVALRALGTGAVAVMVVGWSLIARFTGGAASEYLLAAPLGLIAVVALIPLSPRATLGLGALEYAMIWLATPTAHASAHVLVVAVGIGGYVIERRRQRRSLLSFLRIERLAAAAARIRRMQEQLVVVEKLEALRVLVGGMAHELNNALTVAQASMQQAAKAMTLNASQVAPALMRAEGGLARIRRTVDRLRRFAMAAEGTLASADVAAMLDFALESAIGRARSGVIVDRQYDPEVGTIQCHVSALAEALFQIARNAVESMPRGGVIMARALRQGDRVALVVADQGRGIPPEQLAHVFDPFYQGRPEAAKSGLGLSAVYGLVTALGGTVQIKSDVGRGTEGTITMPVKRVRSETPLPPPPS